MPHPSLTKASVSHRRSARERIKERPGLMQRLMPLPWQLWPAEARLLIGLAAFWSVAGLVVLGSASWWVALREMGDGAFYIKRQAVWLVASWSLLGLTVSTSLRRWLKWSGPALWVGCLMIAATLVMGTTVNGASRWLVIGPLQVQPSELVKPFVVLQAANLFASWKRTGLDEKLLWLGSFGALLLLILKQPNLSAPALMGLSLWMVALGAGLRLRSLFGTPGRCGPGGDQHHAERVPASAGGLVPRPGRTDGGWLQLVQSLPAIGSAAGGPDLASTQKLQYLPIQADFIYRCSPRCLSAR